MHLVVFELLVKIDLEGSNLSFYFFLFFWWHERRVFQPIRILKKARKRHRICVTVYAKEADVKTNVTFRVWRWDNGKRSLLAVGRGVSEQSGAIASVGHTFIHSFTLVKRQPRVSLRGRRAGKFASEGDCQLQCIGSQTKCTKCYHSKYSTWNDNILWNVTNGSSFVCLRAQTRQINVLLSPVGKRVQHSCICICVHVSTLSFEFIRESHPFRFNYTVLSTFRSLELKWKTKRSRCSLFFFFLWTLKSIK